MFVASSTSVIRSRWRALTVAALLLVGVPSAHSQEFPSQTIRIVPFGSAGGPIDRLARVYAEKLAQRFGQAVIVDARPGASGIIAADAVAKAAPDGHTILMTLPLTHINAAVLNPKLPYDPVRDFEPLTMVGTGGPLLLARADAPFSNLKEYAAFAKAKPGTGYGTWGIGSGAHLFGELFKRQSGADIVHVPYKAESQNYSDLYGDVLAVTWANPGSARSQATKTKVLGVTGTRRMSLFPNAPTFAEQGFAGFDIDSWIGLYAPAKTPRAVLDKLSSALREITQLPDVRERLLETGFEPLGNSPQEFAARYRADLPRVAELIKAAGVTAE
jgi:tripartite-type tricarboxylate transporter receptor subunit TctC